MLCFEPTSAPPTTALCKHIAHWGQCPEHARMWRESYPALYTPSGTSKRLDTQPPFPGHSRIIESGARPEPGNTETQLIQLHPHPCPSQLCGGTSDHGCTVLVHATFLSVSYSTGMIKDSTGAGADSVNMRYHISQRMQYRSCPHCTDITVLPSDTGQPLSWSQRTLHGYNREWAATAP